MFIEPSRAIGAYAAVMTAIAAYVVLGAATAAATSSDWGNTRVVK